MTSLRVAATHAACSVLGPGVRFVIWVQGCPIGCRGCVSPQWIPDSGGDWIQVEELALRIVREAPDGLTLTGGEPFAQAPALSALLAEICGQRDLSMLAYTGYTIEHLLAHGTTAQRDLLSQLDILIDGPYLPARHADLLWRGSSNQRIHRLSSRHSAQPDDDRSVGIQIDVQADGSVRWSGVPSVAGFRERFERQLRIPDAPQEWTP